MAPSKKASRFLKDKTIVITGAAHGLGRELALHAAGSGSRLILADNDSSALEKVHHKIQAGGGSSSLYRVNLGDPKEINQFSEEIISQCGSIHGLINNAAVSHTGRLDEMQGEDFSWVHKINVLGTAEMTRSLLPAIERKRGSFIAFICSGIAFMGLPGFSAYASSKGAVKVFAECLRAELYKEVKVHTVFPGPMQTDISLRARHVHLSNREKELKYLHGKGMYPGKAAALIYNQISRSREEILLGPEVKWGYQLRRLFPRTFSRMLMRFQHKLPV